MTASDSRRAETAWQHCLNCSKTRSSMADPTFTSRPNSPPQVRVHGKLQPLDLPPLTPAETKQLAYSV